MPESMTTGTDVDDDAEATDQPTTIQTVVELDAARRAKRLTEATQEARDLREWKEAGEQGDRPETPNLDEIEEEKRNPDMAKATSTNKSRGPGRPKQSVRFAVDGEVQVHKTRGYTLGYLAYDHTAGLARGSAKRLSTKEFADVLAKHGVKDPTGSAWGPIELGGKVFEGLLDGQSPKAKPKAKAPAAAKKAPAKKAAAKKPAARKSTAKKSTAKKAAAPRKSPAKRAAKPAAKAGSSSKVVARPEAR